MNTRRRFAAIAAAACMAMASVPAAASSTPELDRPFNEYTWVMAHNAFANGLPLLGAWLPNQTKAVHEQLRMGTRGLMLDIHESNGRVRLCHGTCVGVEPTLADLLNQQLLPFLQGTPYTVFTLHLEDRTSPGALQAELALAPDLARFSFNPKDWPDGQWPTVRDMADAGQRLLIFTQARANAQPYATSGGDVHLLYDRDWLVENHWSMGSTIFQHDMSCVSRYQVDPLYAQLSRGTRSWPRLFMMNHFHGTPEGLHAWSDNSYDVLRRRVDEQCAPAARRKPNFLAVDFVDAGQVASVAAALTSGAIEFFDGPGGTGNRVCAVAVTRRRTVALGKDQGDRCPPARLRSAVVRDVPQGTRIQLSGGMTHDAPRTVIIIGRDLTDDAAVVNDVTASQQDDSIRVNASGRGMPDGITYVMTERPD